MYDCIVIGGGPAGLSAAIYLARQRLNFVMIADAIGGQALWSAQVDNYLGFHLLDGMHLVEKFKEHLRDYKDSFLLKEGRRVASVEKLGDGGFRVTTEKGEFFDAKSVIVASGTKHRELHVPGEQAFYGRGVTYCSTCDGPLYANKEVIVVGGGNSAMQAALSISSYAKHVTMLTVNDRLKGDEMLKKKVEETEKVSLIYEAKTTKILGDTFVTAMEYEVGGQKKTLEAQGVFIEVGLVPVSDFISFVKKNALSEIEVDIHNQTSVPGVWAAGDVTNVTEKQISVAVGEGSKAAIAAMKWLQTQ